MEDYKRKLELAKERYNSTTSKEEKEFIETLFPELKESEDEKIRKDIVAAVETYGDFTQCRKEEIYAWLEKQGEQKPYMIQWKGDNLKEVIGFTGKNKNFNKWFTSFEEYEKYVHEHNNIFKLFNEDGSHYEVPVGAWIVKTPDGYNVASKAVLKQKPADKVEPKFKVGDWVRAISSGNIFKILSINDGLYRMLCYDGVEANYPIKDVDYDLVYWTIQDANDGDILMANAPFIFNGNLEGGIGCPGAHCGINSLGKFQIPKYQEHWTGHTTTPATKEQCDLLFQKMKEAGYEWDAEKKKLKKIEQKPIWSKEGEANIDYSSEIIGFLKNYIKAHGCTAMNSWVNWLKNIKDRVQLQPKQEWDEANDSMIEGIKIAILDYYDKENADEIISWLESLKERVQPQPKYHWKPSEEQMDALDKAKKQSCKLL